MTATLLPFDRSSPTGATRQATGPTGSSVAPYSERKRSGARFGPSGGHSAGGSSFDTDELLAGCRDRLAHGVATAFAEDMAGAAANFVTLADRATRADAQDRYFAAHRMLTRRGQDLLQQFRQEFVSSCDQTLQLLAQPLIQRAPAAFGELSLIADEDFEQELTIGRLSSRANYNCAQQLTALDRRLAALRRGERIPQDENPLYPKAVFAAFLDACKALGACDQVELVLLQEFGHQVADALPKVYQEINRYLVDRGVLQEIPLGGAASFDIGARAADNTTNTGYAESTATPPQPTTLPNIPAPFPDPAAHAGATIPSDVFAQIAYRLLSSQGQARTQPPFPGAVGPAQALTQLQRGDFDSQQFPGIDPRQMDHSAADLLRRLRSTPLIAWSHPMDAVTVDVVAMLFDLLLNDRDLPDALRAQIGRLQIPVLKVAMMDKAFFADRQHPARRLLDAIAGSATGWRDEELPRLIDKVRDVCEAVLNGFDKDITIFSAQLALLTEFLADEEEKGQEATERRRSEVERLERSAQVRHEVSQQVLRHVSDPNLPELIRSFLDGSWRVVLAKAYLNPGEGDQAWQGAIATMDDLVWSVAPKTTPAERRRLFEALPDILSRLRKGLASVDRENEWDEFFTRLMPRHMEAIRPDLPATAPRQLEPVERRPDIAPHVPAPTPVAAAPVATPATTGPASHAAPDEHYTEVARGLELGAWIEFKSARGTRRAMRLNWSSQQKGAYLFANLQGDDTLIMATTRLAERLRDGTARILSRDSLTERAVAQLMTTVVGDQAPVPTD